MRKNTTQLCAERGARHRKRLELQAIAPAATSGNKFSETNISCMLTSNIPRSFSATIQINGNDVLHQID